MRRVWPDSFVEEANLTVNISALRRQLGETPDGQRYIETVPRKGYRFAVPITQIETNGTQVNGASPAVKPAPAPPRPTEDTSDSGAAPSITAPANVRFRPSILLLGLIVMVLAGLGYMAYRSRSINQQPSHPPRRLAVLPFQNLQKDPNTDFLGYSLADAVITKLGYLSELSVRPSYAVEKYRSQAIDIRKVAADLNVDTLLTGTFLRDGEDLRIGYQLIDVKTENLLWKGAFDLKYDKLLTVQDTVASQVIR
jgi:TolB-like protein